MPSYLILASINAFGILWAAVVWMFAGLIAGALVAIPIFFITLSTNQDSNPEEAAGRVALFVVSAIALVGLLFGAYQEFDKQQSSIRNSEQIKNVPTLTLPTLPSMK